MRPADSANINRVAPYRVVAIDASAYRFFTDNGLVYEVGFVDDYTFFDDNAYQFYLKELTGTSAPRDPKIMKTVGAVIEEFLSQNDSVVIYICDNSDGRQATRNRVFISWFNYYANKDAYTLLTGTGTILDNTYYTAAIVAKQNPDHDEIINAFAFFKMQVRAKFPDAEVE